MQFVVGFWFVFSFSGIVLTCILWGWMTACPEMHTLSSHTDRIRVYPWIDFKGDFKGDFKTLGKADPFHRDETLRGNRASGKVIMERFFFLTNNYLEWLNMVPKCRLRSTSPTQIDKSRKKKTLKNPQGCLNPSQRKTVLLFYLVNTMKSQLTSA